MALRIFKCRDCDHRMRWGASYCGRCGHPAPEKNHIGFLLIPITALVVLFVGVGMLV